MRLNREIDDVRTQQHNCRGGKRGAHSSAHGCRALATLLSAVHHRILPCISLAFIPVRFWWDKRFRLLALAVRATSRLHIIAAVLYDLVAPGWIWYLILSAGRVHTHSSSVGACYLLCWRRVCVGACAGCVACVHHYELSVERYIHVGVDGDDDALLLLLLVPLSSAGLHPRVPAGDDPASCHCRRRCPKVRCNLSCQQTTDLYLFRCCSSVVVHVVYSSQYIRY